MGWAEQIINRTTPNSNNQTHHSNTSPVQSSEGTTPLHISKMQNNQTSRNEHHTFYNEPEVFYSSNSNSSSRWTSPRPLTSMEVPHRPDLDTPGYTRAEVGIHLNSTRQSSPPSQNSGRGETGYHHQRGGGASAEESHRTCPRSEGFLQQYIPSSQEGWRLETCHQPASPEQVHPETPLQDGVSIESPRFYHPRRLSYKDKPEGCLPGSPYLPVSQTFSAFPMER